MSFASPYLCYFCKLLVGLTAGPEVVFLEDRFTRNRGHLRSVGLEGILWECLLSSTIEKFGVCRSVSSVCRFPVGKPSSVVLLVVVLGS